ncbi:glycosyltransferase [Vibrio breoganii]
MKNPIKVSYILLSYNQERYIESALKSAFDQSYENIEFLISDDASNDNTAELIKRVCEEYQRNIKLTLREKNVGLVKSLDAQMKMASGDIIIFSAGDDIALPTRVKDSVYFLTREDSIKSISFNDIIIDEYDAILGKTHDFTRNYCVDINYLLSLKQTGICGASRAIKRELYDEYGNLEDKCQTEDTPYTFRSALSGGHKVISDRAAIKYRKHCSSVSSKKNIKKINVDEVCKQYKKDLSHKKDSFTISMQRDIIKWIEYTENIRLVKNNYHNLKHWLRLSMNKYFWLKIYSLLLSKLPTYLKSK